MVGGLHPTGAGDCEALVKVKGALRVGLEENVWNLTQISVPSFESHSSPPIPPLPSTTKNIMNPFHVKIIGQITIILRLLIPSLQTNRSD